MALTEKKNRRIGTCNAESSASDCCDSMTGLFRQRDTNHEVKKIYYIIVLVTMVTLPREVTAQNGSLRIRNAPVVNLELRGAGLDGEILPVSDERTRITWKDSRTDSKITVSTFAPGQRFSLTVEAIQVKNGSSAGRITLEDGMMDKDLIRNIRKHKKGGAKLRYRASARMDQGNSLDAGMDVHTITFTLTER